MPKRWTPRGTTLVACTFMAIAMSGGPAEATPVATRYAEAPSHAFLRLTDLTGKPLADGEVVQWQEKNGVLANRLVFHFHDGSLYDETVRFSTRSVFRLHAYHLVQKGPSFDETSDVRFDRTGGYTASQRAPGGKEKRATGHVDVPDDVYNGMTSTVLKNLQEGNSASIHYLGFTRGPTLVDVALAAEGTDSFWIGSSKFTATRYVVTPRVTGGKGMIASVMGKQPKPVRFWLTSGRVPTFVRFEGSLYVGGPSWRIELATPRWRR
jgi:hypothetical protein